MDDWSLLMASRHRDPTPDNLRMEKIRFYRTAPRFPVHFNADFTAKMGAGLDEAEANSDILTLGFIRRAVDAGLPSVLDAEYERKARNQAWGRS